MRGPFLLVPLSLATLAVACGETSPDTADASAAAIPLYDDLGSHHHPIETSIPAAQQYFDQGMRLAYAFNHEAAIRSFREAARLDPECAMCWWGVAWAAGPNINATMDSAGGATAWEAIGEAMSRAADASAAEHAWLEAIAARYTADPLAPRPPLDSAFARAMADLASRQPENDDALVLLADALMNLSPWDYWNADGSPRPDTPRILASLETVLARNPDHAGACHLYIHAVEAAHPKRAEACADRLAGLMPGAGHIVHMPGHIYVRIGRYADAVRANEHAVHADDLHMGDMPPDGAYRLAYHPHNWHFMWFAAGMAGNRAQAIEAGQRTAAATDTLLMREPGLIALQHYLATPFFTAVRFGDWQDLLAMPESPGHPPYVRGIQHFARAVAFAATGRAAEASTELTKLDGVRADPALGERIWGINPAATNLEIAAHIAAGEIALHGGQAAEAVRHFRQAADLEDGMGYDEPPTWPYPVRHHLGAALLAAGRTADAEAVYRKDLDRFPENGWSLFGLAQALDAQGRSADAEAVRTRFTAAFSAADFAPTSSAR